MNFKISFKWLPLKLVELKINMVDYSTNDITDYECNICYELLA